MTPVHRIAAGILLMGLNIQSGRAQDVSFTAEVSSTTVPVGERFQISFVLSGARVVDPDSFTPPDFSEFVVLSGPSQQTSLRIINGASTSSLTVSYLLYARKEGAFTIGSASLVLNRKKYATQPLKLTVMKGKPAQQQGSQENGVQVGDNLLLRTIADRDHVRLGEQVTITWKVYTRVGITNSRVSKLPTFEGFWAEDFELAPQPALVNEVYEGKQYRVATIKQTALFPSQSGRLTVSPMEIVFSVQVQPQRRSNDPFDQFFNDSFFRSMRTTDVQILSNPVTLRVDRLPTGAPTGFGNAVGSYSFDARVDKDRVKAGDAVTLKIAVAGTGNIKLLALPKPVVPADIEMFDPTLNESIKRDGGVVSGIKTAEYVLVPRNAGTRSIEPMAFSYYDPSTASYRTLRSRQFTLTVLPGRELAMGGAGVSREDVQLLGQDIRFIKMEPGSFASRGSRGHFGPVFLVMLAVPPIAFIGALAYRKRKEKVYGDLPSLRFERAGREASRRLKTARKLLSLGNAQEYHAEVLRALTSYLEGKLRLSKAALSLDQVSAMLDAHAVRAETASAVRAVMERAEFARFAPGADSAGARKELLVLATRAIDNVEKEFRA